VAAAAVISAAPMAAFADEEGVKAVLCASNPTAKICLKNSFKK
jgi:hypothetical protein